MLPKKKSKELDALHNLLEERKAVQDTMKAEQSVWNEINAQILKVMKKMGKRVVKTKYGKVSKIAVKQYDWFEDMINSWYEKKGLKPPFKKVRVFQPDLLERDINKGKVPRKMLKKWANVSIKTVYVRVDKN